MENVWCKRCPEAADSNSSVNGLFRSAVLVSNARIQKGRLYEEGAVGVKREPYTDKNT